MLSVFRFIFLFRFLIFELFQREIRSKYAGHLLSGVWVVGSPLILIAVYVTVFSAGFGGRMNDNQSGYIIYVLSGLVPWMALQDSIIRGSQSIVASQSLVKKINFPVAVLPISAAIASLPSLLVGTLIIVGLDLYLNFRVGILFGLIPFFIVFLFWSIGLSLLLSVITLYIRDTREVLSFALTISLFASPIFYTPNAAPKMLAWIFPFNPFSYVIWAAQDSLFHLQVTSVATWIVSAGGGFMLMVLAFKAFEAFKSDFGEAL